MKNNPEPVTFNGNENVPLQDCYVFRDNLAHKAEVGIASGISFTQHPNLLIIKVEVKGSKKNTFALGIPMTQAMKMSRHAVLWSEALYEYDECKLDLVSNLFDKYEADLTAAPWTEEDVEAVEMMEAKDELQEMVKQDFLRMAGRSVHVPWEHVWVASTAGRWAAATVGPTVEPSAALFSSWDVPSVAAWVAATAAGTVGHWAGCSAAG